MATNSLSTIQFGGLVSGIDTTSIINGLVAVERQRLTPLEDAKKELQSQVTTLGGLKNKLSSFASKAEEFENGDVFNIFTVSSSNEDILTAQATGEYDISKGSIEIEVQQLAVNEKISSNSFTSDITDLGLSGTFTINGKDITIDSTFSLREIRDAINNTEDIGVTATILKISDTDYRLVLTSNDGGSSGATYSDTSGTVLQDLGILDASGNKNSSNILQNGQDAIVVIDNMTITRTTNVIDDVIPGLEITLNKAEVGTKVEVSFDRDYDAIKDKVQEFVDAYNGVIEYINTYTGYNEDTKEAKDLTNSNAAHRVVRDLRNIINTDFSSLLPSGYDSLSAIGIKTNKDDGTLSIDEDKLKEKMKNNFDAFKKLFGVSGTSDTAGLTYGDYTEDTQSGTYYVDASVPSIGGYSATKNGEIITATDGPAKGLAVTSVGGTTSGNITFIKGVAALFKETIENKMLDIADGYIVNEEKRLNNNIDDYDERIADLEDRISAYETRLVYQFSQMEMQLNQLRSQTSGLSNLMVSNV